MKDGPFQFDEDSTVFQRLEEIVRCALAVAYEAGEASMADRVKEPAPVPGLPDNSIYERTAISIMVQQVFNAGSVAGYHGFNIADGLAHGLAVILANKPRDVAVESGQLIIQSMAGYEARTRAALDPTNVAGRA